MFFVIHQIMKELFHKINSNLKAKIVIFAAGLLVVFLSLLLFYNIRTERIFYINSAENQLKLLSSTIERSLVDSMGRGQRQEVQRIMEQIGSSADVKDLRILSENRKILQSSVPSEIGTQVDEDNYPRYKESAESFIFNKSGQNKLILVKPILNRPACFGCHDASKHVNGILEVSFSLATAEAEINQHLKKLIFASVAISLLLVLSVLALLEFLVNRPISRLREAMVKAETGEVVNFGKVPSDEIGQLQMKFSQMLGNIKELHSENSRKEIDLFRSVEVSNSHARLKGIMEAMPDGITILTRDMVIHDINPRSMEIFAGVKKGDLCYRSIHGRSEPCTHCGVIKVFEDGLVHEHQSTF